ncbi:MAG: polysulfide reductase NrfD [Acidobacteriota bacterium]|nr:polysulfide reductase NrfD [Acidobacteriota bacterium]
MTASYYNLPLLKPPVWTWEVPAYFFIGGVAGGASILGAAAQLAGGEDALVREARWIAMIGSALSAPLLISDLGRPERFLNMLRVFKPQSPMSVGVWTLTGFSCASTAAALVPFKPVRDVAALGAAATGLVMATYTGVLLGATAIPVWKEHVRLLPLHFGASALGSAASLLELRGHRHPALNALALGVAIFETAAAVAIESGHDPVSAPLRDGPSGTLTRLGSLLSGPIPLFMRLMGSRKGAAAATLAGSLITRFAWVEAGKASAVKPAS